MPQKSKSPDPVEPAEVEVPAPEPEPDRAAELAVEAVPPEKPAGAPELVPFQRLRRREKERLTRALDALDGSRKSLDGADTSGESIELGTAADLYHVMADAEDVILSAAQDPAACEAWVASCDDDALMALLRWYMSVMQVGEAQPSSA